MFSKELKDIEVSSGKQGYIYLFKILINKESFKFGHTTKNIKDRLNNYKDYIFDIYYENVSLVKQREYLIKRYLLNDSLFKCVQGNEYFAGPFETVLEVFNYISILDDITVLNYIKNKDLILDIKKDTENKVTESNIKKYTNNEEKIDVNNQTETSHKFKCNECNKEFNSKRSLTNHIKIHNKNFNCIYCNTELCSKQSLTRHLSVCIYKKEQDEKKIIKELESQKEIIKKYEEEYKIYIQEILLLKEENKELQILLSENINLRDTIKDKDLINKNLEQKIKDLESKQIMLYDKVFNLVDDNKK